MVVNNSGNSSGNNIGNKTHLEFKELEKTDIKTVIDKIQHQKETCNLLYQLIEVRDNCIAMFVYPKGMETLKVSKYFNVKNYRRFAKLDDVIKYDLGKRILGFKSRKQHTKTLDNIRIYLIEYYREEG